MFDLDLSRLSPGINFGLFAVAGFVIWWAGKRLATEADRLCRKTGWEQAIVGFVFLAFSTELPEVVTSVQASWIGNASLATNNLFGGIVLQTTLLALADLSFRRGALTYIAPSPHLLLQGVGLALLLNFALVALIIGERVVLSGIGLWTVLLAAGYAAFVYNVRRTDEADVSSGEEPEVPPSADRPRAPETLSLPGILVRFALASLAILVAGWVVVRVSDTLAVQTGLGSSFVGAVFVALSTSLPELSTTINAVRLGAYRLAISNIFGSNAIMVPLLFVADVVYRPGPILDAAGASASLGAAMGAIVTLVYVFGMLARRDRSILGMGVDSVVVTILYVCSLFGFYVLRHA